jgi:hypothetical protein
MIDGEFEARVEGPFAERHPLVKCGSCLAIVCFGILSNYVPLALAVWLVGAPAPVHHSLLEWIVFAGFMVGLLGGMVAFWWYCMVGLVGWVAGGRLTRRQVAAVLGGISLGSVLVAGAARLLGCWDWVFLVAVATMFGCGFAAAATIRVGKALRYLRRGKS